MAHQLLIADDQEDLLIFLEELFSSRGYQVAKAADGDEALELMKSVSPDLILVDYQMPGKNGVQVLEIAREVEAGVFEVIELILVEGAFRQTLDGGLVGFDE